MNHPNDQRIFQVSHSFKKARNEIVKEHFLIHFEVAAENHDVVIQNGGMQQNATT
jgi:hypothetical protein